MQTPLYRLPYDTLSISLQQRCSNDINDQYSQAPASDEMAPGADKLVFTVGEMADPWSAAYMGLVPAWVWHSNSDKTGEVRKQECFVDEQNHVGMPN